MERRRKEKSKQVLDVRDELLDGNSLLFSRSIASLYNLCLFPSSHFHHLSRVEMIRLQASSCPTSDASCPAETAPGIPKYWNHRFTRARGSPARHHICRRFACPTAKVQETDAILFGIKQLQMEKNWSERRLPRVKYSSPNSCGRLSAVLFRLEGQRGGVSDRLT